MTLIFHPVTGHTVDVPADSAGHYMASGWITMEAHQQNLAAAAARAEAERLEAEAAEQARAKSGTAKSAGAKEG